MLVGRDGELQSVATLLDEARRGRSGVLTVVGDPGVGKTALLEEARRLASDMRVISCTGVEFEAELPFASLHELLRPLLGLLPRLPAVQARALAGALALEDGEPDSLSVGAGTLSLLVEAAEQAPLLVVLDDVQWLDRGSAEMIAFAARRLHSEEIAVLAAARAGSEHGFESFPRLELAPLQPDQARRLLASRPDPVGPAHVPRMLAAAAGNPLALLELPIALTDDLPSASTHERLQRAFAQRLHELPQPSQMAMLLAAAEAEVEPVRRAARALDVDGHLVEAERAGLLRVEAGALTFRHPVVRSLVYADASAADRATAHRALAAALPDEHDRDRRAWHLGASVEGYDAEVAGMLEETAARAAARSGHASEARALERAARLTLEPGDRARRLLAASRAEYWSGNAARARELAEEGLALADDPLLHADLLHQISAVADWDGGKVPEATLLRELERIEALDAERSAKLLYQVVTQRLAVFDAEGAAALAPRLEPLARAAGDWWRPRTLAGAAAAYLMAGDREPAVALFRELAAEPVVPAGFAYDYMALEWWEELGASLAETLREGRATGNLLRIAWNQACAAALALRHGRLAAAEAAAAEAIPLAELLGVSAIVGSASAALAGVQAWRGDAQACSANAAIATTAARDNRDLFQEGVARQALALLALGQQRPEEAVAILEPQVRAWLGTTVVEPTAVLFVPDLIEAYCLVGATDDARALLDRYAPLADASPAAWGRAACARCAGALAGPDDFDAHFVAALEILEGTPLVLDRARTQLAYGERLRRQGRRRDARLPLRAAHETFVGLAATPWSSRAAAELRVTGETVTESERSIPELTAQEIHIAGLVAEGKSNKEIAAAIYLSPKTVEYHLANTFRKLDIHSRAELARIVAREGSSPTPQAP